MRAEQEPAFRRGRRADRAERKGADRKSSNWQYRSQAQAIRDSLADNIALFLDDDPSNDPAFFAEG